MPLAVALRPITVAQGHDEAHTPKYGGQPCFGKRDRAPRALEAC
jgi:hypothetical protein